jgi:hypothetical protein
VRHGYQPEPALYAYPEIGRLLLGGFPMNSPVMRGPWVTGPAGPEGPLIPGAPCVCYAFPRPAATGARMPGGQGTDLFDQSTWQRQYRFGPP